VQFHAAHRFDAFSFQAELNPQFTGFGRFSAAILEGKALNR
jgi:hypothetical protein